MSARRLLRKSQASGVRGAPRSDRNLLGGQYLEAAIPSDRERDAAVIGLADEIVGHASHDRDPSSAR